jgi:hypothetical protein
MVLAQGLVGEDCQAMGKKANVVLVRRLLVILHRVWVDSTQFRWTREVGGGIKPGITLSCRLVGGISPSIERQPSGKLASTTADR